MINYNGKNVIVTGASGGMGTILCKKLAEQGAKLSLCSNDEKSLTLLAGELEKITEVFAKVVDITNEQEVIDFFEEAYQKNGEYAAMANLAGLSIPSKIPTTDLDVYNTIMDVNVKGAFLVGKHFADHAADPAIIVNIGSTAAKTANANAPLYCTAKAAVNMLSQGMLLQMGSKHIRVTTINPGGADTAFWGDRPVDRSKLMQAEDVVEIIFFALTSSPRVQIHDIYFESSARF
ncbi:MAG: SDR family NAD(P)-dependent oxidoreductase [Lachnospiraceae bacterium]|nr:SDR family NAD(P)-dependent oxidoreductase [Lachnospiraceae bacterium]